MREDYRHDYTIKRQNGRVLVQYEGRDFSFTPEDVEKELRRLSIWRRIVQDAYWMLLTGHRML